MTKVCLPNGTTVSVSTKQEAWWTEMHGAGFVHPTLIAPDPDQPRQHMNEARLGELGESISAAGVREPIKVTPRSMAPWVRVDERHENAFFVVVSGHRRRKCSINAGLEAVPIVVEIYASEQDHRLEASLLNACREGLTPIEEAREIVRLKNAGWKGEKLCEFFGISAPTLYGRINITKLAPDIQDFLRPELPRKKRLSLNIAGALGGIAVPKVEDLIGFCESFEADLSKDLDQSSLETLSDDELRFTHQRLFLEVINKRQLAAARAIEFIKDQVIRKGGLGGRHKSVQERRYQPQKRITVIEAYVRSVVQTVLVDWPPKEFERIFEHAYREDLDEMLASLQEGQQTIEGMIKLIGRIRDKKKPTHPAALELRNKRRAAKKAA